MNCYNTQANVRTCYQNLLSERLKHKQNEAYLLFVAGRAILWAFGMRYRNLTLPNNLCYVSIVMCKQKLNFYVYLMIYNPYFMSIRIVYSQF